MPIEYEHQGNAVPDPLDGEDKTRIMQLFEDEVVPKLRKLHARVGTLCCEFAGDQYQNWVIHFRSAGSGFEIVEFEYDKDAAGMDLDL
jgi:hypothetical protein